MLKFRTNLRIVATIVACFAVTTMFASCDKDGSDDDGGTTNGKIDPKLVGTWETKLYKTGDITSFTTYTHMFQKDGKFIMGINSNYQIGVSSSKSADYTVSDGKIIFTNIVAHNPDGVQEYPKTQIAEYKFETMDGITYLNMAILDYDEIDELPLSFTWARWTKK